MKDFDEAVRERWAGNAAAFERSFAALCGHTADSLLDAAGPLEGNLLLDVGTGTGTVAALAVKRGALTVGVDPDPAMLAVARPKAKGAVFGIDSLPDLHWRDDAFDAVVANFVINHVGDPRAAVRELARVTRPGGHVAVTVWPHPKSTALGLPERMVLESGVVAPPPSRLPPDRDFSRDEAGLAGLLADAGLVDIRASRISWVHRISFEDYWAGQVSGITGVGELVAGQPPSVVERMRQTLRVLTDFYREGDGLAIPAEALLAVARRRP